MGKYQAPILNSMAPGKNFIPVSDGASQVKVLLGATFTQQFQESACAPAHGTGCIVRFAAPASPNRQGWKHQVQYITLVPSSIQSPFKEFD